MSICFQRRTLVAALAAATLAPAAPAATITWKGTGQPPGDWSEKTNWLPQTVPGLNDDVIIDTAQGGSPPLFDEIAASVATLTVKANSNINVEMGFADASSPRKLTIVGRNGLTIEANAVVQLQKNSHLLVQGAGEMSIALGAKFQFAGTGDTLTRPILGIGDGGSGESRSVYTTGAGVIEGLSDGLILGSDNNDVFILGPLNHITGQMEIQVALVNNGLVHANVDGGRILLSCRPKSGQGQWRVGASSGTAELKTVTFVTGTGDVIVDDGGMLTVTRHFSILQPGDLTLSSGGKIDVSPQTIFEVSRYAKVCPGVT